MFFGTCAQIQPFPTSIVAERCQEQTFNIDFSNVQYKTEFESPALCFGTISTYEYLLPSGWKLGTTTSDGSTWLPGNNSVTVTSDLSTGGSVQIRAANTGCGSGLVAGQPKVIPISRPAPNLYIGGSGYICSGNETYSIPNLPSGATVQ